MATKQRIPQSNIRRLAAILWNDLLDKVEHFQRTADTNSLQGKKNYLAAAEKKHGVGALIAYGKVSLTPYGPSQSITYTKKVKADLARIEAPYNLERIDIDGAHYYVPKNKVAAVTKAAKELRALEVALLTADSEHAQKLFAKTQQTIEGIK